MMRTLRQPTHTCFLEEKERPVRGPGGRRRAGSRRSWPVAGKGDFSREHAAGTVQDQRWTEGGSWRPGREARTDLAHGTCPEQARPLQGCRAAAWRPRLC